MLRQAILRKKLPDTPGVYFFLGKNKKVLYIGRATSLRSRVRSYFASDIAEKRSVWIGKMLTEAKSVDFRKTDSVLEAIFLEADLIKKFKPPYNTDQKDDKSFNCVVITKEAFPQVLVVRKKNLDSQVLNAIRYTLTASYGPFSNGFQLHTAMKLVRRIFPYRDLKCTPPKIYKGQIYKGLSFVTKESPLRLAKSSRGSPCFSRQIGLCPGICTGEVSRQDYAKTIRNIKLFFEGKKKRLLQLLQKEMKAAAKAQAFEKAGELKKTISALRHIQDIALLNRDTSSSPPRLRRGAGGGVVGFRIEGYDVSHFGGRDIVGAMAVVESGEAKPSEYRLFKIRSIKGAHETAGLREMLQRRFNHPEWTLPNLIVVDGNEVQRRTAAITLMNMWQNIPVVAVVKDERHKPREIVGFHGHSNPPRRIGMSWEKVERAILLANAEAHRFALKFQRKRRGFQEFSCS